MIILNVAVFILGLCIGSFLNVLIYRLPRGLGFVRGRSFCPKCKKKIAWFDNVPLVSFILLRGRCRDCQSPISWRYPLVELLTGGLFVLAAKIWLGMLGGLGGLGVQEGLEIVLTILLFSGLIVIFFIDLEHQIIPDEIVIPLIILFSLRHLFPLPTSHIPTLRLGSVQAHFSLLTPTLLSFVTAIISSLFLYSIYLITKGKGMGFGDVKLAFLMGLVLGFPKIIVAFYLAFLTGAFVGVILILLGKAKLKKKIAFGPFLVLGTIVSLLWGEKIIHTVEKFF